VQAVTSCIVGGFDFGLPAATRMNLLHHVFGLASSPNDSRIPTRLDLRLANETATPRSMAEVMTETERHPCEINR